MTDPTWRVFGRVALRYGPWALRFVPVIGEVVIVGTTAYWLYEMYENREAIAGILSVSKPDAGAQEGQATDAEGADGEKDEADPRAGKKFTPKGKREVKEANAAENDGEMKCEGCGKTVVNPQQHQKGVTPPDNEAHVDHIEPRSKGGAGSPSNGQVLCRTCNLGTSDN